uniref:NADH dehydrogenase [ubiquinone] 1 beta subcomplex subunit 8, mitochondrial-like n=1 Tax=Geotrypetes seraphini TaxID=260995 RepID=A0A6P8QC34_GEOSA|nr:NADH dehydrogenase [ubiquinone] 1 beta subcomplex subunit 8, mitochondrial-like [Geotrypetes seraphini]
MAAFGGCCVRVLTRRVVRVPAGLLSLSGARAASGISKDMLPGSYPKTPKEREAAAKKYNLRLEDYEPYPDDGMGFGDYPKLPEKSQQERDPWYSWDHTDLRRNWGEPMPKQFPYNNLYEERGGDLSKAPEEVKNYEI